MGKEIYSDNPPNCDYCTRLGKEVPCQYDGKTNRGPWAFMCREHWLEHGCGQLGTGYGQEYKPLSEKPAPVLRDCDDLDEEDLWDMVMGESNASTSCPEGCEVEADGVCPHGYKSHLLELGII